MYGAHHTKLPDRVSITESLVVHAYLCGCTSTSCCSCAGDTIVQAAPPARFCMRCSRGEKTYVHIDLAKYGTAYPLMLRLLTLLHLLWLLLLHLVVGARWCTRADQPLHHQVRSNALILLLPLGPNLTSCSNKQGTAVSWAVALGVATRRVIEIVGHHRGVYI